MARHQITLIPGDGVGPELCDVARSVVQASGVEVDWDFQAAGLKTLEREGTLLPERALASVAERGAALKGPLAGVPGHPSANVTLRRELHLYVNVRPVLTPQPLVEASGRVDVVVIRMTLEDLTAGIGFEPGDEGWEALRSLVKSTHGIALGPDAGVSLKPISSTQARRLHEAAFAYAERHGRRQLTTVHKAPNQPASDGVFLAAGREVAQAHPNVPHNDRLIDAICHDLARKPGSYDVIVAPAQYGDIVSDLAAGLAGGLGLAASANLGDRAAIFEAVHGTAPRLAGRDSANPFAMVGAAAMLLAHIGEADAAARVEAAVGALIADGRPLTYDIDRSGRPAATSEVSRALVRTIEEGR